MKSKKTQKKSVRLSTDIVPIEYDLRIRPDLHNFTFEGIETISLSLKKPVTKITLHSKELEIETAEILVGKTKVFASKIIYDEKSETATFVFKQKIPVGKTKLALVFKGILNDKMRGFYKSTYVVDGKENHMATTQFEATDARRAFPCFDEPAHKAVFHVSLIIPKGKSAISNTLPVSVMEHDAGFEIVRFSPTPKMSTYLLAFIVGDFEYVEKKSNRGVIVRVYTVPGKKHQAQFSLDVTVSVLEFYEKYFDIPYPLETLDMIAIPDFASLAMENWGAVTFREIGLLVDEQNTSVGSKEMIAEVIAHELAHQWFGNLVTMEWWTHLWLNEGFASYIPYIVIEQLFPEWNIWERFNTQTLGSALRLDALKNTHPIEVAVHHPDEIGEIFDEVSYSKGASVIRMLADYLGEKDFRDGLRYYLKKHSYKNTETVHLWEAFTKVSKKPVARIMREWTGKGGYPVVEARIQKGKLLLSQKRFFASPISARKVIDKTIWQTPIILGTEKSEQKLLLSSKQTTITTSQDWVKINMGESGFFRTAYQKELLEQLREPVMNKILPPRDRLGIIRDLFALSEAGVIPTTDALEFLSAYKNEDNYTVWVEIASGLARIEQLIAKTNAKSDFDRYVVNIFSPITKRLGWDKTEGESHTTALLRSLSLSRAGRAGDIQVIREARKRFNLLMQNKSVSPDIRGAIYGIVSTHGTKTEYLKMLKKYKTETLHEEKNRLGGMLGDFNDTSLLTQTCDFAMSPFVRTQDTTSIISSVAGNPIGRDIWWNFVTKNWKTLVSRYGDGGHTLGRLVKAISASSEKKHLAQFKKFFASHDAPGATRAIEQVMERLESNTAWLARDGKAIAKFLKK